MPRNNEREQRVIQIMQRQQLRIAYTQQIAAALRDAGAEGEQAIRVLAIVIERLTENPQHHTPDTWRIVNAFEHHLDGRAYDNADPADILAALAQLLHERTAIRIADAYTITHPPTIYAPGEERLLSAAEASEQASAHSIAYAADLED